MEREYEPLTVVGALLDLHTARARIDEDIATWTAEALDLFADGKSQNVAVGPNWNRTHYTVTRVGRSLVVTTLPVVHASDLRWPEPGTAEGAEFGPAAPDDGLPASVAEIDALTS